MNLEIGNKIMTTIRRSNCVACEWPILEYAHTFKNVPIFMGTHPSNDTKVITEDQRWVSCVKCKCVQLGELIEPSVLYKHDHTPGTIGNTWTRHHNEFANFISNHIAENDTNIVEVGAGSGILFNLLYTRQPHSKYTIIDPNMSDIEDCNIIRKFVSEVTEPLDADVLIHSHTMEHFYSPIDELKTMAKLMKPDGTMFISVPLIEDMIQDGYTNGLNFEHTYCTTEDNIRQILERAGFKIIEMYYFNKYNVFIKAWKHKYINSKQSFDEYVKRLENEVEALNKLRCVPFYLFGAHVFSQTLLYLGVDTGKVIGILDNDPTKQGKVLYGTNIKVSDPSIIIDDAEPVVVVKAGQYTHEISQQLKLLNPTVHIIT